MHLEDQENKMFQNGINSQTSIFSVIKAVDRPYGNGTEQLGSIHVETWASG